MKIQKKEPICLLIDNKSTINIAKNPVDHGTTSTLILGIILSGTKLTKEKSSSPIANQKIILLIY